ncbi:MAG: SPOR domain-containing protein [Sulfuricaulis sp.]
MADRDDAHTEFNPKHRIVGAIVIVALVVIVVPLILNRREPPVDASPPGEPAARGEIAGTPDTKLVVTPVLPLETQAAGGNTSTKAVTPTVDSAPKPQAPAVAPVEKPPAVKKPPAAPASAKTTKSSSVAEKITKGWIVQVGTFSNRENAIHLRNKLVSHGHGVHTETVTLAGKKATRLRVGPFREKRQAEKAQALIRKETGVRGAVQTYP